MWATLHDNLSFGSPPPPLAPLPPLRSTLSSLSNQISFSPSPSTIFRFIKLSYHKLNESSARFLPPFFSPPSCPFHNFPSSADPPTPLNSPHLHQILPAALCGFSPTQKAAGGLLFLRGGSVRWWFSGLRAALLAPGFKVAAPGLCRVKFPSTDTWGRQAMKWEVKIKVCAAMTDAGRDGWGQKQQAVRRCCQWKGKMETWWWGGTENRQVEREEAVSATGKQTFLAFLWRQLALNQLFAWL